MARAKQSDEEKILDYFNDAPVQAAGTLFNVVKGIMKRRGVGEAAKKGQSSKPAKPFDRQKGTPTASSVSLSNTASGGE